ncbi:Cof-type HAD-IIB family hydrolase [Spiroplasma tabanidicola]|uniref:HAD superfamily hydrolase n=1 Tax=Spiroplasma tabanidicola TaxID=324079 RepID=A0A6I6C754_9MOLU|nr:HAD family hydrolase [Spiroplasma tabanidicola]QGS52040.1 HAD superfamily hydrolase [Spiroplasma tabanidicola]
MKNIKVVVSDLDGTLLFNGEYSSEKQNQYLRNLQKNGIMLIISTGRSWKEAIKIAKDLEIDKYLNYIVCENGSYVSKVTEFKPEMVEVMNPEVVKDVYLTLTDHKFSIYLKKYTEQYVYYTNEFGMERKFYKRTNKLIDINKHKDFENISYVFSQFPFENEANSIFKKFDNKYKDDLTLIWDANDNKTRMHYLISSKNSNKGSKTLELLDKLGYKNEETIFFGDSGNDIPALEKFKFSVVMGNATEQVKKAAKYKTNHCLEDGVMNFLKSWNI